MKKMKSVPLNEELYNYILDKFVPEDPLIDELIKETETEEIPLIQVSPDQGRFLYLICKMIKAENALEIGTLTGFSGIHIARGITGILTTVDINKKNLSIAEKYFNKAGLSDKIKLINSAAGEYMEKMADSNMKFDFIFIDADKLGYPEYLEKALKISSKGTVIIFDNTIKDGKIIQSEPENEEIRAVQKINDIMGRNDKIESMLIPIGDGFTIGIVKFK
jgi:predicted O-methyltransferase YrrM